MIESSFLLIVGIILLAVAFVIGIVVLWRDDNPYGMFILFIAIVGTSLIGKYAQNKYRSNNEYRIDTKILTVEKYGLSDSDTLYRLVPKTYKK